MLKVLRVDGNSMHPALRSGAFVFIWYTPKWINNLSSVIYQPLIVLKIGNIVAINHYKYGHIIKRIAQIQYDKYHRPLRLLLKGDNSCASVSTEAMGWAEMSSVMGKVVYVVNH